MCDTCKSLSKGNSVIHVKSSFLDSGGYTKMQQTPSPAVTTSATAYARFEKEVRDYFRLVMKEALSAAQGQQFPSTQSLVAEVERVIKHNRVNVPVYIREFLVRQFAAGSVIGLSQLPANLRGTVFPSLIEEQIETTITRLQNGTANATKTTLRSLIGDGLELGESVPELTARIQDWGRRNGDLDRQVKWRARRVARTESSRALNEGQVESWKESGLTRMKWVVAPNPCDFCKMMKRKGETQPIDQPFFGQGETLKSDTGSTLTFDYAAVKSPPLHPNCRCTLKPIISFK
jgi:hypothetical protein